MATRFVKGSYQEIIDLHTESDHVTALGIHTPTGSTPRQMFKGFFDQYKKYKYLGCSIKLVPAARLPADPLAVSYDAGEPTIDPRDMLNPLMFHGCHGNDLGTILNRLYGDNNEISDSIDGLDTFGLAGGNWIQNPNSLMFNEVMERLYYKALTDNTWKKAHPQRGFMKKGLHPLVYSMATNRQLMPGSLIDTSDVGDYGDMSILGADPTTEFSETNEHVRSLISRNGVQFFTPKLTSLGWIDTRNELTSAQDFVPVGSDLDDIVPSINNLAVSQINFAELPKIYMGVILLPPAYKTEQYYRMVVNHRFAFKGFRGISFMPEVGNVPSYYNANSDLFSPDQYGGTTTSGGGSTGGDAGGGSGGGSTEPDPEPEPVVYTLSQLFSQHSYISDRTNSANYSLYNVLSDANGNIASGSNYIQQNGVVAIVGLYKSDDVITLRAIYGEQNAIISTYDWQPTTGGWVRMGTSQVISSSIDRINDSFTIMPTYSNWDEDFYTAILTTGLWSPESGATLDTVNTWV